jgi:tetratricopeptide (TPR) repeat protein
LLLALALSTTACAPGVYVRRLVPASQNLGTARKLALVAVRGNVIGVEKVIERELAMQISLRRHFTLNDAVPLRLAVPPVPPRGQLADIRALQGAVDGDYYLVANVTDFRAYTTPMVRNNETRYRGEGAARLELDLIRAADGKVVNNFNVFATAPGPDPWSAEAATPLPAWELQTRATREAVIRFLGYITPHFVTEKIVFDDAEELKPGLKLAQDEDFAGAMKFFQEYAAKTPPHAGAVYNVAVLYEVQGEYEGAKQWYRRAIELSPQKELYVESERALFKRLEDAARLEQ